MDKKGYRKIMKQTLDFSKYSIVGVTATSINIFLMWVSVDLWEINTLIATSTVVTLLFFYKFYGYIYIGLFHKEFFKFFIVNVTSAVLNVVLIFVLVELIGFSAAFSATIVVIILFILRFIVFKLIGVIKS